MMDEARWVGLVTVVVVDTPGLMRGHGDGLSE